MSFRRHIPAYCHHKPTGQARVRINGKDHYLGKYGTPESHDRYDELIADFLDDEPQTAKTLTPILALWWKECKRRYSGHGKGPFGEAVCWRPAIRLLRENFGEMRAEDLGPVKLRRLIESEAKARDWSLSYAKKVLWRVQYIYKWAVSEELVSLEAYQRLETIQLRHGRKTAKIPPVDVRTLARTLRHLPPKIGAMVRLQRLTGMRPGELVRMRPEEIDRKNDVWVYVPGHHKTEHKGKDRSIYIGPRAQRILAPWLLKAGEGFVFPSKGTKCYNVGFVPTGHPPRL